MKQKKGLTRRDFLRGTAGVLLATGLPAMMPAKGHGADTARARVIVVRDRAVLGPDGKINRPVLQSMLDEAVRAVTGEQEGLRAWSSLFRKSDTVGVKSNSWRLLPTPPELEEAITVRLRDLGIPDEKISVDDRGVLDNRVFLNATALVNVRPVRTHHWAGVGTCLKNYIMFAPSPSSYHPNGCSDLGRIWTTPVVKGKTRLNILCALTPQFYGRGANFFDRRYVWPYKGLIVGTDPVAVSAVGAALLQAKRIAHFGEDRPLDVAPVHITEAERKYKLGVSDLGRIDIVRIGWTDEVLL